MASFDAYVSDYLLVVAGVLGGNVLAVSLAALLDADLPAYLGIAQRIPEFLPSILAAVLANLVAAIELTILPALGVFVVLYVDFQR